MPDDLDTLLEVKTGIRTPMNPSPGAYVSGLPSSGGPSNFASSVMSRYRDAYLAARVTTGFGGIIKGIGIFLAIVILGVAATMGHGSDSSMYLGAGFVLAVIIGAIFYLLGILVSAQGQILKASLDGAVNNSPFLTNDQKALTMSL